MNRDITETEALDVDSTTKAILLIAEVRSSLARGTRHFATDGRPLRTIKEILMALRDDGRIIFEPKQR